SPTTLIWPATLLPFLFFFFTHPPTTHIYTLSLHDALPIFHFRVPRSRGPLAHQRRRRAAIPRQPRGEPARHGVLDRHGAAHAGGVLPAHDAPGRLGLLGGRRPVGRVQHAHGRDRSRAAARHRAARGRG